MKQQENHILARAMLNRTNNRRSNGGDENIYMIILVEQIHRWTHWRNDNKSFIFGGSTFARREKTMPPAMHGASVVLTATMAAVLAVAASCMESVLPGLKPYLGSVCGGEGFLSTTPFVYHMKIHVYIGIYTNT